MRPITRYLPAGALRNSLQVAGFRSSWGEPDSTSKPSPTALMTCLRVIPCSVRKLLPTALDRLRNADPDAPAQIDSRNPARVRRALEIVLSTARPLAESRSAWSAPCTTPRDDPIERDTGSSSDSQYSQIRPPTPCEFRGIVLDRDREELRQRIADNVDAMFAAGVVDEVRLAKNVGTTASRAIGFREIQSLLRCEIDIPACKEAIIASTRRYAKRQRTWCRNQFPFPTITLRPSLPSPLETAIELLTSMARS